MRAIAISVLSVLLAGSCAASPSFLAPDDEPQSAYGAFLAARYAGANRDLDASAQLYADALAFIPQSELISQRAFYAALMAGDFARADAAAVTASTDPDAAQLARLYLDAAELAGAASGVTAPTSTQYGPFGEMISGMLADWSQAARSRSEARAVADRLLESRGRGAAHEAVHRALILERAGYFDAAEEAYQAADGAFALDDFTTVLQGAFLERRGRRNEARALYEQRLADTADAPDPEVAAALERVSERRRAPRVLTPAQAAARSLFAPSTLLTSQAPVDYSALYLRLVQRLDPDFQRNAIAVAQMLEGLDLAPAAREVYDTVEAGPFAERAAVNAAWLSYRLGDRDAALARTVALSERTDGEEPRLLLADLFRLSGRCAEAADIYLEVVEDRRSAGLEADWRHIFYAAVCRQTTEGWYAAEPLFEAALDAAPNEPRVLNHLGYNLIVIGADIDRGFELVAQAARLAPNNGAILDSLGWGHFKQGRLAEAVRWLENAVERSPGDPTINWHLGDAYAASGRDLEAQFQWRRAMELDPSTREAAILERRLELGLEAGPADLE